MKPILDGYWESGYDYYLEINGRRAILRDYAKRIIFETSLKYDKAAVSRGERAELKLGETVLSRTFSGEPMTWIKGLWFNDGQIVMDYYYTIMGDKQYTLNRVEHGPFDDIIIRDREILPRIQGLWLEWSRKGIDEKESGLRIKGNVLRYGSKDYDFFKIKIHAISLKGDPGKIILTPADLVEREFPGMTQFTVEDGMITGYPIVYDVAPPMLVFLRKKDYGSAAIPDEALKTARNLMEEEEPTVRSEKPKVTVISKSRPNECGGTDATQDESAPKTIRSDKMILFDVTSAFNGYVTDGQITAPHFDYVSAFAAPAESGTFLFLNTRRRHESDSRSWALIKENILPGLDALVREYGLASQNGFHSTTHGLPENFGGSINIKYESGEKISVSDNQHPVLSAAAGAAIAELFGNTVKGEGAPLPDIKTLRSIRFTDERNDGGFTRAVLSINADGTGINEKEQKFSDPTVYKTSKAVSADTVAAIKQTVVDNGVLAWVGLPPTGFASGGQKNLTFVFDGGQELTVDNDRMLPDGLRGAFFDIEIELSTNH